MISSMYNIKMNPWENGLNSIYKTRELDEADILDINNNSVGKLLIYSPRKSLDTYFDINFNKGL